MMGYLHGILLLKKMNKVLIIAAHPDDEVLGCGGTIAKHTSKGDIVHVLFMTNGEGSRDESSNHDAINRQSMAHNSANILGIDSITFLNFPDNSLDSIPLINIIKKIEDKLSNYKPKIIYTHHVGDLNVDHQVTHKAVMTACRPLPGFSVEKIFSFGVLSSTEWSITKSFQPNFFVEISETLKLKLSAMESYTTEIQRPPYARSIESINALARNYGSSIGVDFAEGFMVNRIIMRDK
jgi:N-acetylglucosamine malate deacetylase 1